MKDPQQKKENKERKGPLEQICSSMNKTVS
jgi:hypothetical protein